MRGKTGTFPDQVEDIKPSNFVVGAGDGQNDKALTSDYVQGSCQLTTFCNLANLLQVYIVDFGLAKRP